MRYFEDLKPGDVVLGPTLVVERDEMVEFARRWDPQPFHLDDAVANAMFGEGGVTAPGVFVMAIRTRLLHNTPDLAVIAALGWDELRFSAPVRAGDTLELRQEWLDKRASDSKPDRGVARSRLSLVNQDGVEVMSHIDTILVRRGNLDD
ncbi:MAG: MaoC/PaaZ C-terminal domain-containing protein [Acidimicrobiia bacterium]|nr:MaoC/PaaZ C-terminal domain-containing protein [Acidimicrobiia bacterium]